MNDIAHRVRSIQLEMALEVKRICDKNSIKYSLIAGSLLGAVRHDGFIPWDDDLDIGMLRKDYDKFIEACKNDLKSEYYLQTLDSDKSFALPIAKLRKIGTKYIEKNSMKSEQHNGIFIDIFPFDNVPQSPENQKKQNRNTYILKRILLVKNGYEVWAEDENTKRMIYTLLKVITAPLKTSTVKNILSKQMRLYNHEVSEKVVAFGGSYGYEKESIERSFLEELTTINFENYSFSCPARYKDYLSYFYGDFMTPPPENKRYNRHKILEIDLGE